MRRATRPRTGKKARGQLLLGALAAFAVWLVAGAHVASTLHFALVSHRICAEHGALEHGHEAEAEHAQPKAPAHAALQSGSDEAEHEHCPLIARPHEELALAAPARFEIASAPRAAPSPVQRASAPAPARDALLLFAPKQSPPA
ncbi:MAG TPA: hypothetical protein VGK73_07060 [Polyangiaceae bacterium]